jgi:hypothetical protein
MRPSLAPLRPHVQTGKLQNPDVQRQLSVSDIPGKPMPLAGLAALTRGDHEKLSMVVKTAGMALQ